MKTMIVVALALSFLSGCASVQAKRADNASYTCIPNDAHDRGPFQTPPTAGELEVKPGFSAVGVQATSGSKDYTCIGNSAMDRGVQPDRTGQKLTIFQ